MVGKETCFHMEANTFSLTKRSRVRAPLGTESPLLGSALPPNVGLPGANPDLVGLQCGYRTPGGKPTKKYILIKHVLQSLPIYTLTVLTPPKGIIKLMERHFNRFFWGSTTDKDKYHWSSWKSMCFPRNEGGLGMRNMKDICDILNIKKWWGFRCQDTLWAKFTKAKYCIQSHLVAKVWVSGNSHIWKNLTQTRSKVEHNMIWNIRKGDCSFGGTTGQAMDL
uniref:Retrotransposon protein, unclassified n=1 Tax=Solanum tuberosum TaxID=4113 RepID=M1B667_SOLTU